MPSLRAILKDTMFFNAVAKPAPLGPGAAISCSVPTPIPSSNTAIIERNPCWSWTHDPATPGKITDVGCKVRGMGMDYKMSMPVLKTLEVQEVMIRTRAGVDVSLPLTKAFVLEKYYAASGLMGMDGHKLWPLEAQVDQSCLIVFGYKIADDGTVTTLPAGEVEKLGDNLMPEPGGLPEVLVDQKVNIWIAPRRVIVVFGLTCCKERSDYSPADIMGANRLYPHVMVMSSTDLKTLSVTIDVTRPSQTAHAGPMLPTTAHQPDDMLAPINTLLFNDSNTAMGLPALPTVIKTIPAVPPLPTWDNFFDYYDTEPIAHGVGTKKPVVMVDATKTTERTLAKALKKIRKPTAGGPPKYTLEDLVKVPRQGEFDNIHLAPAMAAIPKAFLGPAMMTSKVNMAPFCVHDCLHMHVRWGATPAKSQWGFSANGSPYAVKGAPMVPHEQTVRISLLSDSSYAYEAVVQDHVEPGKWHVIYHHGMAYANDIWDPKKMELARMGVEMWASGGDEHDFSPNRTIVQAASSGALSRSCRPCRAPHGFRRGAGQASRPVG